jgi:hypothetical protein
MFRRAKSSRNLPGNRVTEEWKTRLIFYLKEVERLIMHLKHHVPPEVVRIESISRLVDDIRFERTEKSEGERQ